MESIKAVTCKHCGSDVLVKYGKYKGIQLYWCQACKRKVKGDNDLFHMKVPAGHVNSALDWYYRGLSIQDISKHLNQAHGYWPSKHIVFDWVDKFTTKAIKHFEGYKPNVGTTWIADEIAVYLDKHRKAWLWAMIDARTRFILATKVSFTRSEHDAQFLMARACEKAGKTPAKIITSKLASYFNSTVPAADAVTEHRNGQRFDIKNSASIDQHCHGTLKDKTRKMRVFRDIDSATQFADGFKIYYNYLRHHEVLNGKTPAEAADIRYDVKNWADLTRSSVINSYKVNEQGAIKMETPLHKRFEFESPLRLLSHYPEHTNITGIKSAPRMPFKGSPSIIRSARN